MPLTQNKAFILHQAIETREDTFDAVFKETQAAWRQNRSKPLDFNKLENYDQLQMYLIEVRNASLDRKSIVIDFEGKPVRVYPHQRENIKIEVDDIFARGIDSARAATEILRLANLKESTDTMVCGLQGHQCSKIEESLIVLINQFQENMEYHHKNQNSTEGLENAKQELKRFNGVLSYLLVQYDVIGNRQQANKAINFVRDFLWKKDICTASCVIENLGNDYRMLRYADPMTFGPAEFKKADSTENTPMDFWTQEQPWFHELAKAMGDKQHQWFNQFFTQHLNDMKTLSSTPMSRYTPNPANAFDCSDILIKKEGEGKIMSTSHHLRTAITEPLDASATKSRQEVTDWNHLQMISRNRLQSELTSFMEKWGPLFANETSIPFTILHQTLVGDEVTFTPDQRKTKASKIGGSVIDSKLEANAAVRDVLSKSVIIREKETGTIQFLSKEDYKEKYGEAIPPLGWQEVKADLLETNDCINMWQALARVRNNDVNDARQLITNAVTLFKKVVPSGETAEKATNNLSTVINFLNSNNHSLLTPYKFRGTTVKKAVSDLTIELGNNEGAFNHLLPSIRENLALSLQAAVELKCTVHETWAGSLHRNIANFTRDYVRQVPILGHLVDWAVRGTMLLLALVAKTVSGIVTFPHTLPQLHKHRRDRQEIYKAAYEGVLAETIGALRGGCMSSADRAGEMAEQRVALRKQFVQNRRIISYNDTAEDKEMFYKTYGRSQAKHVVVTMGTGIDATSDGETRGLFRVGLVSEISETSKEKKLAKDFYPLRSGQYDDTITNTVYKKALPVGKAKAFVLNEIVPSHLQLVIEQQSTNGENNDGPSMHR